MGKRALFWVPSGQSQEAPTGPETAPLGKHALFSAAPPESDSVLEASDNPLAERGAFVVECSRCHQISRTGWLDLLMYQFPLGFWLPRGKYDRRMVCPACRRRVWASVTLHRS